jgi:hypothetical protein
MAAHAAVACAAPCLAPTSACRRPAPRPPDRPSLKQLRYFAYEVLTTATTLEVPAEQGVLAGLKDMDKATVSTPWPMHDWSPNVPAAKFELRPDGGFTYTLPNPLPPPFMPGEAVHLTVSVAIVQDGVVGLVEFVSVEFVHGAAPRRRGGRVGVGVAGGG